MQFMIAAIEHDADFEDRQKTGAAFQAYMDPWYKFSEALGKSGVLRSGNALEPGHTATCVRVRDGERLVEDGPYADSKEQLGGYFIVDVNNIDEAISWGAQCPSIQNGRVDVAPIAIYDTAQEG